MERVFNTFIILTYFYILQKLGMATHMSDYPCICNMHDELFDVMLFLTF